MWTSITFVCGSKCRSQTFSSNIVRVTTWPAWRIRYSSRRNSRAVTSTGRPPRATLRATRSISRSATRSRVTGSVATERRASTSSRASSSSNAKGLVR